MTKLVIKSNEVDVANIRLIETLIGTRKWQTFNRITLRAHLSDMYGIEIDNYLASQVLYDLAERKVLSVVGDNGEGIKYMVN